MKHYVLSIYQPEGGTPPPEVLGQIMRDVQAVVQDIKDSGAWVFNGGCTRPRRRQSSG